MADQTLVKTFTDIADAIRAKDGSTGTMKPTEMPGKIAAIETGTDTSDATVTASDLASGVIAYGKDGKVTGNVSVITGSSTYNATYIQYLGTPGVNDFKPVLNYQFGQDVMFKKDSYINLSRPGSDFGDATAADVAAGKTFTSTSGLKVTGTGKLATADGYLVKTVTYESVNFGYEVSGNYHYLVIPAENIPSDLYNNSHSYISGYAISAEYGGVYKHKYAITYNGKVKFETAVGSDDDWGFLGSANSLLVNFKLRFATNIFNKWGAGTGTTGSLTLTYRSTQQYSLL